MNDTTHWCDDKDAVVEYLYGDLDAEGRRVFEGHLRTCRACADEADGLRGVRTELAGWLPPQLDLGITVAATPRNVVASAPATVLHPPQWAFAQLPAWTRAAAAVLAIGAGLGLANVQVRYGAEGLNISTGWLAPAVPSAAAVATTSASPSAASVTETGWRPELAALEADLRKEMQSVRSSAAPAVAVAARSGNGDGQAILRRVQSLIQESERRQQQDLAIRLTQFGTDIERQRRTDLVRLEQGFDRFQGRSAAASARQQEVLNLLVRASTTKVP